jgi:hypothetical protein
MLQFPGLAAWVVGFLVCPQLVFLNSTSGRLPEGSLQKVAFMALLCFMMTLAGYYASRRSPAELHWKFSTRRLLQGAALLALVGQVAIFLLRSVLADWDPGEMWSGLPVRYLFFVQAGRYAFSIGLIIYLLTRNKWALFLALPNAADAIMTLILHGRRTSAAVFALTVLCAIWFTRRKTVPRWAMLVGILAFTVFVLNISQFRYQSKQKSVEKSIERLQGMDWKRTFEKENFIGSNAIEMENAAYIISVVDSSSRFDYGATLWNWIVMAYVPRQLVGSELKQSLMMGKGVWTVVYDEAGYVPPFGSCTTGIAEAFYSFWYYGACLFFLLGYIMRRLWEGSMRGGIVYQAMYFNFIAMGVGVYNGSLGNMLMPWPHMLLFLVPVFLYARLKPGEDFPENRDVLRSCVPENNEPYRR